MRELSRRKVSIINWEEGELERELRVTELVGEVRS